MHRILLALALFAVAASAQPDDPKRSSRKLSRCISPATWTAPFATIANT